MKNHLHQQKYQQNKNATKKFNYITSMTVSWSNFSHSTGMAYQFTGPNFPFTATNYYVAAARYLCGGSQIM